MPCSTGKMETFTPLNRTLEGKWLRKNNEGAGLLGYKNNFPELRLGEF
jgi:hypothetical protein